MSAELQSEVLVSTFEAYCRLRKAAGEGADLPRLELVALSRVRETPEKRGSRISDFTWQSHEGFCRFRSGLTWSDNPKPVTGDFGEPVFAEWRSNDAVSHRLRVLDGVTTVWTLTERPLDTKVTLEPGETPFLRQRLTIAAHAALTPHAYLAYHSYFGAGADADPHSLRQVCDRFFGFSSTEIH